MLRNFKIALSQFEFLRCFDTFWGSSLVDMISALRHGPVGRTYEEDDEDEQTSNFIDPADSLELNLSTDCVTAETIFFSLSFAAKPITNALITTYDFRNVGVAKYCVGKVVLAEVFHSESKNCFVVSVANQVEDHLAPTFASLFDKFQVRSIVIADSLSIAKYIGQGVEGALRTVVTSSVGSHELLSSSAFVTSTAKLEIGNLVTGVAAAILSHTEARQIPAVAFLVLSKVYVSVSVMKAFALIAPLLQSLLGAENVALPTNATYNELLKRDPYVLRTENLYS